MKIKAIKNFTSAVFQGRMIKAGEVVECDPSLANDLVSYGVAVPAINIKKNIAVTEKKAPEFLKPQPSPSSARARVSRMLGLKKSEKKD